MNEIVGKVSDGLNSNVYANCFNVRVPYLYRTSALRRSEQQTRVSTSKGTSSSLVYFCSQLRRAERRLGDGFKIGLLDNPNEVSRISLAHHYSHESDQREGGARDLQNYFSCKVLLA